MPAIRSGRSGLASDQRGDRPDRPQVRVQAEALAKAQEALLGARRVGVGGVPLRPADGAEQHGVGRAAGVEHLVGEGRPVRVDRGAADRMLVELEVPDRLEQPRGRGEDLGADPVAGQDHDAWGLLVPRSWAGIMPDASTSRQHGLVR